MVVKKGKSAVSSKSIAKKSSRHIHKTSYQHKAHHHAPVQTELHKLHPYHLKKMIREVQHVGHEHRYEEKKREAKREEMKRIGCWDYFKKFHKLDFEPLSIKILIFYLVFLGLFNVINLVVGVKEATAVIFGFALTGIWAFIFHILIIVLVLLVAYGIGRREVWGFDIAIAWFILGILNSILSAFLLKSFVFEFVRELTLISSISVILINSLVIWYLFAQKKYFFYHHGHKESLELKDKIFVYTLFCFWLAVILIGATLGVKFFKATIEKTNTLVDELNGKQLWDAMSACEEKSDMDSDLCYVVLATMQRDSSIVRDIGICDKVVSDFLKFTCRRAAPQ